MSRHLARCRANISEALHCYCTRSAGLREEPRSRRYTPMEFVLHVLERFFNKDRDTAQRIMMRVHEHGIGECGIYTYEVAETKVMQVMEFSRKHEHPLQCVMEKT